MLYAVVHYPDIDTHRINRFRKKYDPQFHLIGPHITLVFPFPAFISETDLTHHVESVLKNSAPFPIRLQGLQKSRDDYLFLLIREGNTGIKNLHTELYTGILAAYKREDLPYFPHLTLGSFSGVAVTDLDALEEAEQMEMDFHCRLDRLHIVKIDSEKTQIVWSRECLLRGNLRDG
jgi:2'-5' RNA ligase